MVLTNWTTHSNDEYSHLDRNVDLCNAQTLNTNISHISSNGYYGFLNVNNHVNTNTTKVNQSPAGNNDNDIKQNNAIKQNDTVYDIDTPMMDIVAQQSNGEHFVKMANGSFPAISNNNTSKTFSSISNGASCGGGGVSDRKKRSCIDDDNEDDEELQTESIAYGKRVCPDNTWDHHHHHFPKETSKSVLIATDNDQQSYFEPMNVEPTNKKYDNIQLNKNVSFCPYEVSVKNNVHANSSSQSHHEYEPIKDVLKKDNCFKTNIAKDNNGLIHIHNDNQLNNCTSRIIGTRFDDDILLENLYYQTHGGGKYFIWQNDTEI